MPIITDTQVVILCTQGDAFVVVAHGRRRPGVCLFPVIARAWLSTSCTMATHQKPVEPGDEQQGPSHKWLNHIGTVRLRAKYEYARACDCRYFASAIPHHQGSHTISARRRRIWPPPGEMQPNIWPSARKTSSSAAVVETGSATRQMQKRASHRVAAGVQLLSRDGLRSNGMLGARDGRALA